MNERINYQITKGRSDCLSWIRVWRKILIIVLIGMLFGEGKWIGNRGLANEKQPSNEENDIMNSQGGSKEKIITDADYPSLESIPEKLRYRRGAKVTVGQDGTYWIDGIPSFLIGPQLGEGPLQSFGPTPGYHPSLEWLFGKAPDYQAMLRLGFNTISIFITNGWVEEYISHWRNSWGYGLSNPKEEMALRDLLWDIGVPVYVDYTAAGWTHGVLHWWRENEKLLIPEAALNTGGMDMHWVPYSCSTPEGKAIYKKMFEHGAKWLREHRIPVLFYELFNEPAYHDPSPYNRQLFVSRMEKKYKTIDTLNHSWRTSYKEFGELAKFKTPGDVPALFVEWTQFLEDIFTELCEEAVQWISAIDPRPGRAPCSVQPLGGNWYRTLPNTHVNLYKLSKICDVIALATGGGCHYGFGQKIPPPSALETVYSDREVSEGLLQRAFIRSIAQGKPIYDGEMYLWRGGEELRTQLWWEMMHGSSAVYWFKWDKRTWDWRPADSEERGRAKAKEFPYIVLNPYVRNHLDYREVYNFRVELQPVQDIFVERGNQPRTPIALLLSNSTHRWAQAIGDRSYHEILTYTAALTFSHVPFDVILEEQMVEENRHQEYKIIIAPAVLSVDSTALKCLDQWVQNGNTLVVGIHPLPVDPLGNPNNWFQTLGIEVGELVTGAPTVELISGDKNKTLLPGPVPGKLMYQLKKVSNDWKERVPGAVFERKYGQGRLIYINARLAEYPLAALLKNILPLESLLEVLRPDEKNIWTNVEVHYRRKGKEIGYVLFNWDAYPKPAILRFPQNILKGKEEDVTIVDVLKQQKLEIDNNRVCVFLPPQVRTVLLMGPRDKINQRIPTTKFIPFRQAYQTGVQILEQVIAEATKRSVTEEKTEKRYSVDTSRIKLLDLKPFMNRDYVDKTPHDGMGGWTDQGENCLNDVEWGIQTYAGVPFEMIRPDMNNFKTVLVMKSKHDPFASPGVTGIPVESYVSTFYFLHCTAWTKDGKPGIVYKLHYTDGTSVTFEAIMGVHIDEWWTGGRNPSQAILAWKNTENKGFYCTAWKNPYPEREIATLDVLPGDPESIGILLAVSIEVLSDKEIRELRSPLLFDGGSTLHWDSVPWGNTELIIDQSMKREGRATLYLKTSPKSNDWSGVTLRAKGDGIPLDSSLRKGHLVFYINGASDEWGNPVGKQKIQISLNGASYVALRPEFVKGGGEIDTDPHTWQRVEIPLQEWNLEKFSHLREISFQWQFKPPTGGVYLDQIRLIPDPGR